MSGGLDGAGPPSVREWRPEMRAAFPWTMGAGVVVVASAVAVYAVSGREAWWMLLIAVSGATQVLSAIARIRERAIADEHGLHVQMVGHKTVPWSDITQVLPDPPSRWVDHVSVMIGGRDWHVRHLIPGTDVDDVRSLWHAHREPAQSDVRQRDE